MEGSIGLIFGTSRSCSINPTPSLSPILIQLLYHPPNSTPSPIYSLPPPPQKKKKINQRGRSYVHQSLSETNEVTKARAARCHRAFPPSCQGDRDARRRTLKVKPIQRRIYDHWCFLSAFADSSNLGWAGTEGEKEGEGWRAEGEGIERKREREREREREGGGGVRAG